MNSNNVLLPMILPKQKALRDAVSKIIRTLQLAHDLTDAEFAGEIVISKGTVKNARNKETDLNATTIARIGARFGAEALDPYAALYGARNVPIEAGDEEALPTLSRAVHKLAVARSPASELGVHLSHNELTDMLPDLRAAQRVLNGLITRAEKVAA